jgi:hypothetical protein
MCVRLRVKKVLEFLIDVLSATPPDVRVIVTEYSGWGPVLKQSGRWGPLRGPLAGGRRWPRVVGAGARESHRRGPNAAADLEHALAGPVIELRKFRDMRFNEMLALLDLVENIRGLRPA